VLTTLYRFSLFWDFTHRRLVICYRDCRTIYRFHLQVHLKVEPIGYAETSVTHYQSTLRKIPGELRSRLQCGGSLKSRTLSCVEESGQMKICLTSYSVACTQISLVQALKSNDSTTWLPGSYISTKWGL
jgi:hypothetical protein